MLSPLIAGPVQESSAGTQQTYSQEIEQWHAGRIQGLKKEHGWLSLIALEWLHEGKNTIPSIGTIRLHKGTVTFSLRKNIAATLEGKKFSSGVIVPDKDKILFGTRALSAIKRGDKFAVRVWDSENPARKNFTTIERFPLSPTWKIEARWEPYAVPKKVEIPTVIPGLIQEGIAPGVAVFTMNGKEYRLEPTVEEGETDYFFVFGDKTNGRETYGAGRFLYTLPPKDGMIVLDFNRSYNPPCAFTDFATCPVPSRQNRLPFTIEAGEKKYKHH